MVIYKEKFLCLIILLLAVAINICVSVPSNASGYKKDISYIEDMQNLQDIIDIIFTSIQDKKYINSADAPIIMTKPNQVISNIQNEILFEYMTTKQIVRKQQDSIEIKKITQTASIGKSIIAIAPSIDMIPSKKPKKSLLQNNNIKKDIENSKLVEEHVVKSAYLPLKGSVVMNYGELNSLGIKSRGLMLQVASIEDVSSGDIVAPMDGIVKFAGKFGHFKQLLILEHKEGYHSLISGFKNIVVKNGDKVFAGDVVGHLAAKQVYYELRYKGKPIDPRRRLNSL